MKVLNIFLKNILDLKVSDVISKTYKTWDFILSIPHSGLLVPLKYKSFFDINEDCLIEIDLFSDLPFANNKGAHLISKFAPFFIDMNRNLWGDPNAKHHLQNDPFHYYNIQDNPMLKKEYSFKTLLELTDYYFLYHNALEKLIKKMKEKKGYALVIDCHSMTSVGLGRSPGTGKKRADFVIGDLNNTSAHSEILEVFFETLKKEAKKVGLSCNKNIPYSGGFITKNHANPDNHVHVIQLEVVMKNYMHECTESKDKRYKIKKENLEKIRKIIQSTIDVACKKADEIYSL